MNTKTVKGKLRAQCPRCGKWGDAHKDFYWRDGGTKLYAHKPCEIERSSNRAKKPAKAKKSSKAKKSGE